MGPPRRRTWGASSRAIAAPVSAPGVMSQESPDTTTHRGAARTCPRTTRHRGTLTAVAADGSCGGSRTCPAHRPGRPPGSAVRPAAPGPSAPSLRRTAAGDGRGVIRAVRP
ncbi:unnamed protein product [[Actinomadura] parvosata subsp. kistnae]|nr:unnamed protein product [Actinomadura parvosata subsp. kistnae]